MLSQNKRYACKDNKSKKDVNDEKVVNDSLVSAGEDAGIIEQGVEGKVQIEVALDDRFFH